MAIIKTWSVLLLSLLTLHGQTSATKCESTVNGDLEILPLTSKIFSNSRSLRVWLPPGYHDGTNAARVYPVLYLLDGQMLFDRCTEPGQSSEWGIDETLTRLIAAHSVEPLIVVGIDNTGSRAREFAPYRNPLPPYAGVPSDGEYFPDFMVSEVMPLISERYRISKVREHTGIGGSSLGATAALYTILQRPDVFGLALLESTSLQLGNGQLLRDTNPIVMGPIRISIGVGTEELGGQTFGTMLGAAEADTGFVALSKTLAENMKGAIMNRPVVKLTVQPGAHHTPQYWGARFAEAIQFLYPPGMK